MLFSKSKGIASTQNYSLWQNNAHCITIAFVPSLDIAQMVHSLSVAFGMFELSKQQLEQFTFM